ncbi:hypothetical protein [Arthrobacter sp. NPDC092385]|uniref:hypothetical protein n=1 Tax=Arthrobacter sp. NPDC092385 TaxID=3363943 RepID=UPI0037FBD522
MRHTYRMNALAKKSDRLLLAILSGIAVLVIIALAVVFTRGEPAALDESSPAGIVQRYSAAVVDGDTDAAAAYLTTAAGEECRALVDRAPLPSRVVLISTDEREDSALVRVSLVTSNPGGPFGPSEYETEDRFSLQKVGGQWKIDQAPYQLLVCSDTRVGP